jgi:hypothetical protein
MFVIGVTEEGMRADKLGGGYAKLSLALSLKYNHSTNYIAYIKHQRYWEKISGRKALCGGLGGGKAHQRRISTRDPFCDIHKTSV